MKRQVKVTKKAAKQALKLPIKIKASLRYLIREIELLGPVRGNWKNYAKLGTNKHHCHLKAGKPTYVACWEEIKGTIVIEVYYVGTHEKAPY